MEELLQDGYIGITLWLAYAYIIFQTLKEGFRLENNALDYVGTKYWRAYTIYDGILTVLPLMFASWLFNMLIYPIHEAIETNYDITALVLMIIANLVFTMTIVKEA